MAFSDLFKKMSEGNVGRRARFFDLNLAYSPLLSGEKKEEIFSAFPHNQIET
jgi:hypothetical protein